MKNTRKKLLVSSIAALLVSAVALSTATFAWFTSSTSVTANGIGVQTTKSSELKISKKDLAWADSINYDFKNKTLRPVSSADGENWYSSVAAAKTAFTSNGTYTPVSGENLKNYVFVDMLNIKNAGGQTCNDVKITISASMPSTFARLAVVPCDEQTVAGTMPSAATNFKANIFGTAAGDSWKPYNGTALESTAYTTAAAANGKVITVGNMAANTVKSYKVLVWFEGEDEECFDITSADLTVPNIEFSVSGTTANQ